MEDFDFVNRKNWIFENCFYDGQEYIAQAIYLMKDLQKIRLFEEITNLIKKKAYISLEDLTLVPKFFIDRAFDLEHFLFEIEVPS